MVPGFCFKEVVPLPRSHCQLVGPPLELSKNCTNSGLQPDVVLAVKFAETCENERRPQHKINEKRIVILSAKCLSNCRILVNLIRCNKKKSAQSSAEYFFNPVILFTPISPFATILYPATGLWSSFVASHTCTVNLF